MISIESFLLFFFHLLCKFFLCISFLNLHDIVEGLYFHCNLSVCISVYQWTKFQLNGCTDLNAIFAKWLLIALVFYEYYCWILQKIGPKNRNQIYVKSYTQNSLSGKFKKYSSDLKNLVCFDYLTFNPWIQIYVLFILLYFCIII